MMKAYLTDIIVVGEGMFSNEVIVQYYDSKGQVLGGFFDKQFVKDGKLEVSVLYSDNQKNNVPPHLKRCGLLQALVFRMLRNF